MTKTERFGEEQRGGEWHMITPEAHVLRMFIILHDVLSDCVLADGMRSEIKKILDDATATAVTEMIGGIIKMVDAYSLVGVDGNAYAIMAYVSNAMKAEGRTQEEIKAYQAEAQSDSYDNLLTCSMQVVNELLQSLADKQKGGV